MPILTPPVQRPSSARISRKATNQNRPLADAKSRPGSIVLLVDDDASVLESLRRVLVQSGLNVVTASNGEQALEKLDEFKPSLIITDLCMGSVSGWDLVFHHHLHESRLPFIIITALPLRDAGGVEKFAEGFFQKPLNLDALLAAIHTCLNSRGVA